METIWALGGERFSDFESPVDVARCALQLAQRLDKSTLITAPSQIHDLLELAEVTKLIKQREQALAVANIPPDPTVDPITAFKPVAHIEMQGIGAALSTLSAKLKELEEIQKSFADTKPSPTVILTILRSA